MKDHQKAIQLIIQKTFNQESISINRMKVGLGNEVYLVGLKDQEVIVRLNEKSDELMGSEKYIPLFKSKGIKVPKILASDYLKSFVPYYYQILSKIEGRDIGLVIHDLTEDELIAIAQEIGSIFRKLEDLPTNGQFGFVYGEKSELVSSWLKNMEGTLKIIKKRGLNSGVIDEGFIEKLDGILQRYSDYFKSVPSTFYYDDMSSKNVMIHHGVFQGLVDLDGVAYGDYLETVGRIKASWYGTKNGDFYTQAVMDALELDEFQRKVVTVYALFHRSYWLCEAGIKFNENTSTEIDWGQVEKNKQVIHLILKEVNR